MEKKNPSAIGLPPGKLSASVQIIALPVGLYLVSVRSGSPSPAKDAGNIELPAVHVALGPGTASTQVEFLAGPDTQGTWLYRPGHQLVIKVLGPTVSIVITSVSTPGGRALDIGIRRLEDAESTPATGIAPPLVEVKPSVVEVKPAASVAPDPSNPRIQLGLHIRGRGDVNFPNTDWAGKVATGAWIEAFSVTPVELLAPQDLEYKGLTGSGFETPWLGSGSACGTRGMSVPLVGFAVRLKGKAAEKYDCEYSGYFQSGVTIGPMKNGAPCRSSTSADPLEGLLFKVVLRRLPVIIVDAPGTIGVPATEQIARRVIGPRFGKLREGVHAPSPASPAIAPDTITKSASKAAAAGDKMSPRVVPKPTERKSPGAKPKMAAKPVKKK